MSNNTQVLEVLAKVWTSRGELEAAEIFPRIIDLLWSGKWRKGAREGRLSYRVSRLEAS